MMTRTAIAILLSVLLATAGAARGAARRVAEGAEGGAGLSQEEEREARELAASFVRRFAATRDFAPLLEEFFVGDIAERLRGEGAEENSSEDTFPLLKFVAPETLQQLSAAELRRFYVATMNCYFLAEINGRVSKFVKNETRAEGEDEEEPEFTDYFPPDALAAARRDPLLARIIAAEADDSDRPSEPDAETVREGDDERRLLEGVGRFNEATAVLEEVAAKLRAHLKSLPAWPLARLLGEDLAAGALAEDGMMSLKTRKISQAFRAEPEGSLMVCAGALMFHVDLVKVEGRFRVINVSSEEYELQSEERKRLDERLAEFFQAIESGDADSFEAILRDGINVNIDIRQGNGGMTPLHYAALHNRADMLRTMIAAGANVNAKNAHGNSVLIYALGSVEMTAALLNAGADVNAKNGNGKTALEAESGRGTNASREVIRILKSFGARE